MILTILTLAFFYGYSKVGLNTMGLKTEPLVINKWQNPLNVDPCLAAALNAQSNAFYAEYVGHQFCANSVTNGSLALSELGGCYYAFTAIRQAQVANIQNSFVPCPSGNGVGIAYNNRNKTVLSKG